MIRGMGACLGLLAWACSAAPSMEAPFAVERADMENPCGQDEVARPGVTADECWIVSGLEREREIAARANAWCEQLGYDNSDGFVRRRFGGIQRGGAYLAQITCVRVRRTGQP